MTLFLDIFLLILSGGFLIASGVFSVRAAVKVTDISDWETDNDLESGHSWLTRASVIAWISVVLVVISIIIYLIFGLETAAFTSGLISKGLLFIILAIMIVTGSFSAVGASFIRKSTKYGDSTSKSAFDLALTSSILALGGVLIIGGVLIWKFIHNPKREEKKELGKEIVQMRELKEDEIHEKIEQLKTKDE